MTNYQMPVLTDSERKELAEYLTACVENRCVFMPISDTLRLGRLRNQIALASLTAEKKTVRPFGLPQIAGEGCWVECEDGEEGATQLYTAPPVPALKPINLPAPEHDDGSDSQVMINAGFANRMRDKCIEATLVQCEQAAIEYKKSHPLAVLTCGEVYE